MASFSHKNEAGQFMHSVYGRGSLGPFRKKANGSNSVGHGFKSNSLQFIIILFFLNFVVMFVYSMGKAFHFFYRHGANE